MAAATQPRLFSPPPGKASFSPWSECFPSGRRSPQPHRARRQRAQAASAGSTPAQGTHCAPARSPGAARLQTSARQEPPVKRSRKLGYPNVQIFTEETPGRAACQRSSPAGRGTLPPAPAPGKRRSCSAPLPGAGPAPWDSAYAAGRSGANPIHVGNLGVTAGGDAPGEGRGTATPQLSQEPARTAAREPAAALCKLPVPTCGFVPDKYQGFAFLSEVALPGASPRMREISRESRSRSLPALCKDTLPLSFAAVRGHLGLAL